MRYIFLILFLLYNQAAGSTMKKQFTRLDQIQQRQLLKRSQILEKNGTTLTEDDVISLIQESKSGKNVQACCVIKPSCSTLTLPRATNVPYGTWDNKQFLCWYLCAIQWTIMQNNPKYSLEKCAKMAQIQYNKYYGTTPPTPIYCAHFAIESVNLDPGRREAGSSPNHFAALITLLKVTTHKQSRKDLVPAGLVGTIYRTNKKNCAQNLLIEIPHTFSHKGRSDYFIAFLQQKLSPNQQYDFIQLYSESKKGKNIRGESRQEEIYSWVLELQQIIAYAKDYKRIHLVGESRGGIIILNCLLLMNYLNSASVQKISTAHIVCGSLPLLFHDTDVQKYWPENIKVFFYNSTHDEVCPREHLFPFFTQLQAAKKFSNIREIVFTNQDSGHSFFNLGMCVSKQNPPQVFCKLFPLEISTGKLIKMDRLNTLLDIHYHSQLTQYTMTIIDTTSKSKTSQTTLDVLGNVMKGVTNPYSHMQNVKISTCGSREDGFYCFNIMMYLILDSHSTKSIQQSVDALCGAVPYYSDVSAASSSKVQLLNTTGKDKFITLQAAYSPYTQIRSFPQ